MNILAICSALDNTYLAFEYENERYSEIIKSDKNYHSLYLISKIKEHIKKNNMSFEKFDAICVNCGPGSFTGIRVALSVAKVLAGELNIPLIPLDSASILLEAFDRDVLLMDARRDMYFIGTKESIELVYKDKIDSYIQNKSVLTDKRSAQISANSICYEDIEKNLGEIMLNLAKEKYEKTENKDEFNYLNVCANYIQTPPIFS